MTSYYEIYHWDTFDNESIQIGVADTLEEADEFIKDRYKNRIRPDGADKVDVVDQHGKIVKQYNVG